MEENKQKPDTVGKVSLLEIIVYLLIVLEGKDYRKKIECMYEKIENKENEEEKKEFKKNVAALKEKELDRIINKTSDVIGVRIDCLHRGLIDALVKKELINWGLLLIGDSPEYRSFSFMVYKDADKIGVNKEFTRKLVSDVMVKLLCDPQYRGGEEAKVTYEVIREKIREISGGVSITRYISDAKRHFIEQEYCDADFGMVHEDLKALYNKNIDQINKEIETISRFKSKVTVEFWPLVTFCAIWSLRQKHDQYPPKKKLPDSEIIKKIGELFGRNTGNYELRSWLASLESQGLINGNRVITIETDSDIGFTAVPKLNCGSSPQCAFLTCKMLLLLYAIFKLRKKSPDITPAEKEIVELLNSEIKDIKAIRGKNKGGNKEKNNKEMKDFPGLFDAKNSLYAQNLIDKNFNIIVDDIDSLPMIINDLLMVPSDGHKGKTGEAGKAIIKAVSKIKKECGWDIELMGDTGEEDIEFCPLPESVDDYIDLVIDMISSEAKLANIIGKRNLSYIPALQEGQDNLWKLFDSYHGSGTREEEGQLFEQMMRFAVGRVYDTNGMFKGSAYSISKNLGLDEEAVDEIHESDYMAALYEDENCQYYESETEFGIQDITSATPESIKSLLKLFNDISDSKKGIINLISQTDLERQEIRSGEMIEPDAGKFISRTIKVAKNKDGYESDVRELVKECCAIDAVEAISDKSKIQNKEIMENTILAIAYQEENVHFNSFKEKINKEIVSKIDGLIKDKLKGEFETLKKKFAIPKDDLRHSCFSFVLNRAKQKIIFKKVKNHLPFYNDHVNETKWVKLANINESDFLLDHNFQTLFERIYEQEREIDKDIQRFIKGTRIFDTADFLSNHFENDEDIFDKNIDAEIAEKNKKIDQDNHKGKMSVLVFLDGLYRHIKEEQEQKQKTNEEQKKKK